MGLRDRLDQKIGLAPSDDPRRIKVGRTERRVEIQVVSTPGARVTIGRAPHLPHLQLAVLWCMKNGVPAQLLDDGSGLRLDGAVVDLDGLRRTLPK